MFLAHSDTDQAVTYSPALTLVPTYECFNRCSYCNFRVDPAADTWMSLTEAKQKLEQARSQGIIEILILSGEVHPKSPRRAAWLERIFSLCALAHQMGFLPHSNVGPLSLAEMATLQSVNVSMGLMLEQITPALMEGVHRFAPSKLPEMRLKQLHQAGELRIPFTTGLLVGIGESDTDRIDTLAAIARCHDRWGHIQEVILQPYQPGVQERYQKRGFPAAALAQFVATARQHLPAEIALQVPPNLLLSPAALLKALDNGARDLGGIGPVDEVNPSYGHSQLENLEKLLNRRGYQLTQRLPVYPQYDGWLPPDLRRTVTQWRRSLSACSSTRRGRASISFPSAHGRPEPQTIC